MADLYPSSVNSALGTQVPLSAASETGDVLHLAGINRAFLLIHNASVAAVDVTLAVPGMTWNGHNAPDTIVNVPASGVVIVPVKASLYQDENQLCPISYSSAAGVRVAAVTS